MGVTTIDFQYLNQRIVLFSFLRRSHGTQYGISCTQAKKANLGGRDIDIIGRGQIVEVRRAEEAIAISDHLEYPFALYNPFKLKVGRAIAVFLFLIEILNGNLRGIIVIRCCIIRLGRDIGLGSSGLLRCILLLRSQVIGLLRRTLP